MVIGKARNGSFTAQLKNCQIHSSYNPEKETISFLSRSEMKNQKCIIIIGSGLGYIEKALLNTDIKKIISISLGKETFDFKKTNIIEDKRLTLMNLDFQKQELKIDQWDALSLKMLEWDPVCKNFRDEYSLVMQKLKSILKNLNSNLNTTRYFGKKWLRNTILNYYRINNYTSVNYHRSDIIICAAGTTLDEILPLLKQKRSSVFIVSVSSALAALKSAGLIPDICILSDPGHYTLQHLQDGTGSWPLNYALPFSAASWTGFEKKNVLPLYQSSSVEKVLGMDNLTHSLKIRESGTVSSTAVMAALQLTTGRVFLAGQDFAFQDVKQHCDPHVFMERRRAHTNRHCPLIQTEWHETNRYEPMEKIKEWKSPSSFSQYRQWFSDFQDNERLYQINPSSFFIENMKYMNLNQWGSLESPEKLKTVMNKKSDDLKKKREIIHYRLNYLKNLFGNSTSEDPVLSEIAFILAPQQFIRNENTHNSGTELKQEINKQLLKLLKL